MTKTVIMHAVLGFALITPFAIARANEEPTIVNVNTATSHEMEASLGPVVAASIANYRKCVGGFTSFESLLDVDGIDGETLKRLRLRISLLGK